MEWPVAFAIGGFCHDRRGLWLAGMGFALAG
jgi:hypothetical protein